MSSLQEQLLKAGLTNKQKVKQANTEKRRKHKQQRSGAVVEADIQQQVKQSIAEQQAQKKARDLAISEQKKQQLAAKELMLRIKQILQHHQITHTDGDIAYHYTDPQGKVKTLYVNEPTQKALMAGKLAVCGIDNTAYIVTQQAADKLYTLDQSVIWLKHDQTAKEKAESNEDDPYAEFQIPDDLMW
jgi:hypothetical protein